MKYIQQTNKRRIKLPESIQTWICGYWNFKRSSSTRASH